MKNRISLMVVGIVVISTLFSVISFSQTPSMIKFKITAPDGYTDESILRIEGQATHNFDWSWDAWKIFTYPHIPHLYTYTADSGQASINSIPVPNKDSSVFMYVRAEQVSGTYTLSTEIQTTGTSGTKWALRDLETGDIYQLDQDITHTFDLQASSTHDYERFEIFISAAAEVNVIDKEVTIINKGGNFWNCSIYDSSENLIQSEVINQDNVSYSQLNVGEYTATIEDQMGIIDTLFFTIEDTETPGTSGYSEHEEKPYQIIYTAEQSIIRITETSLAQCTINIYSTNGQLLEQLNPNGSSTEISLNNKVLTGIYIIELNFSGRRYTEKMIR